VEKNKRIGVREDKEIDRNTKKVVKTLNEKLFTRDFKQRKRRLRDQ